MTAILSADVVGYSRLMEIDEADTLERLKSLRRRLIEPRIAACSGRIVKLMGDGALVEFASVVDAVACAVEIQRAMVEAEPDVADERRVRFRIGINLGDIMIDDDDIYGDGVNVAARVQSLAAPGGIAVSATVREHVGSKLAIAFEDIGEHAVKNIERPVRVYCARLDKAPVAPAKRASEGNGQVPAGGRPSVAVLPFLNMSGDPEQEYFSDGISEDIITDLSKISGLFVVARNSVFTFKGKPVKVQQVSRELGVSYVLEGSVRKAGSRVRITAQLINGTDGGHVWADRYDRDLTDIFAIQDDITRTIVDQLKVKLLPREKEAVGQVPTESMEAYTHYLRGRQFLHRHSKSYYLLAKRMFMKAIELDPLYARAYAGVADCDSFLFLHYNMQVPVERILATSAKALELEGDLAEAHASRGLALSLVRRFSESDAEFKKAVTLAPNSFEVAYLYARANFAWGEMELAAEWFKRAADIKPDDYQSMLLLIGIYRALGREQDLMDAAHAGVKRAEEELARHPEDPRPAYLGAMGLLLLGDIDRAREWASRALAIDPDDILTQYNIACFHAQLGEVEEAISLLERLLPHANPETLEWIKHDSDLDPIRPHPRYQNVLKLIG
ncbi:MAG TPA: adenylate/guanylate cyclase domain-containing protein [Dongiaceae bacterium]|nr:adenylate/guanylate cyclase domain-containing protein [Dongiaceae bacterium]